MDNLTTEKIEILSDFLTKFQNIQKPILNRTISVFNQIIPEILYNKPNYIINPIDYAFLSKRKNEQSEIIIQNYFEFISNFQRKKISAKRINKETSRDFNLLRLFKIGETMHSLLLANILNPNSEHGQGNLFLLSFLNQIGIENPEKGQWIVTAEKGRIDILLKRVHPHSVVVIENKSNFAVDQNNQLYRYWHQEIYYPNRHRRIDYTGKHPEKYQIIYLTPSDSKHPTSNSLIKPKDWPIDLPSIIPITPIILRFNIEIVDWLSYSIQKIPNTNYRLTEYIKQYIEFWK